MHELINKLKTSSITDSKGKIMSWELQTNLSKDYNFTLREVEKIALENDIIPARYQRNRNTLAISEQLALFNKKVAVVGCGGLGGYIIEEVARLGIGSIELIDADVFEEHNLNRQLLAKIDNLGISKTEVAKARVNEINPICDAKAHDIAFDMLNGVELLRGVDLVFDALDCISTRLKLVDVTSELNIPMVHGAIAGWYGQITTSLPGDKTLQKWYKGAQAAKGIEAALGNPAFTPATVASIQVAEACKVLLNKQNILNNKMLTINLLDMEFEIIEM
ncbi:thiamine biosynthesis protein ThiF [Desulfuribacillus alkaliarsenatis]|uniref:Thiamine biosynthesis protein ThiF n=2 Tax=Desulfuribacillus alkaliarsenatis TaxID=766136 RepID=A0A1E5G002_9FIRM|nr:thiamine biosynthesis protein ThiF [Desulfuribacillus alkaliarsenatis]